MTPLVEAGRVYIPSDKQWALDFLEEITNFPVAQHDDCVDAATQAMRWMRDSYKVSPFDEDEDDDVPSRRPRGYWATLAAAR